MEMIKKLIHIRQQEIFKADDKRVWSDHLFLFANEFGNQLDQIILVNGSYALHKVINLKHSV